MKKIERLITELNHDHSYVLKHYFPEYPYKYRKEIYVHTMHVMQFKKKTALQDFSDELYDKRNRIIDESVKNMPHLLASIILNTLGFEANEDLKDTIYKEYQSKGIKRFGKSFINAQYDIYRNQHENLLSKTEEETQKILKDTLEVVNLVAEIGGLNIIGLKEILINYKNSLNNE
tara:strand:+ start:412 stop:936 length:525 start_codon:yes stop_codon:yes gene_type:complete